MESNGLSFQHKIWKDCVCLYLERAAPCRSISATVSLNNPPSGSSSRGPAPPGWWADPWAGTAGRPAPSRTAPSYVPPPAHGHTDSWRSNRLSHSLVLHPVCRYVVNSAYLHDSHSTVCDSWPVDSPDHHPDSSEGADPRQGSVYLLEEIHQRAWERKERWMLCANM